MSYANIEAGLDVRRACTYDPTDGKVDRYQRTLHGQCGYARAHRYESCRRKALTGWLHIYNRHRLHTALGGRHPSRTSPKCLDGTARTSVESRRRRFESLSSLVLGEVGFSTGHGRRRGGALRHRPVPPFQGESVARVNPREAAARVHGSVARGLRHRRPQVAGASAAKSVVLGEVTEGVLDAATRSLDAGDSGVAVPAN